MSENYQNKYQLVFNKGCSCTILNDPQFHGNVTFIAGQTKGMPPTSQKVKEAIETVDKEGLLTDDKLWWAIYRVLTMPEFGYPTGKPEFCKTIENLAPEVSHKCVYNNWRNVSVHKLSASPDKWESIECLSEAESRQRRLGIRLLQLLSL